jgi:hypothetical protein
LRKEVKVKMKKQTIFGIFGMLLFATGCTVAAGTPSAQPTVDEVGTVVAATMQALASTPSESVSTQIPTQTQISGTLISFENVSFVIPNGLARGSTQEVVPAVSEGGGAPWEVAPAYVKFILTGYQLQGKFHEPGIYVYPVDEYTKVHPTVGYQIEQIKLILAGSPISKNTLPRIPWFNADSIIGANVQTIKFQHGAGVRELTLYAQYLAPINNHELIYQFEGLTEDGKYYVLAILPITAPILPEDEKPDAVTPPGGVPIPPDLGPDNTIYYDHVTEKLNALSSNSFTPSLTTLDTLIQSILVTSP